MRKMQNIQGKFTKDKRQSGFTMIELLLVIGIIIALSAIMIYAFLSRANKQAAFHTTAAQVSNIVTAERTAVQRQGSIIEFSSATDAAKLLPYGLQEDIASNPDTSNAWGGAYSVANVAGAGQFIVTLTNIPASVTDTSDYQAFLDAVSRLGNGGRDNDANTANTCVFSTNTLTCTFDNN